LIKERVNETSFLLSKMEEREDEKEGTFPIYIT